MRTRRKKEFREDPDRRTGHQAAVIVLNYDGSGLKVPTEYTRGQLSELIAKAHADVQAEIVGVGRSAPTVQSVD